MKRFTFLSLMICLAFSSFGQKKGYGIIGFDVAFPQNAPSSIQTGIGITLGYERAFHHNLTWTLQISPNQFPIGSPYLDFTEYQIDMIPVLVGIKYYPTEAFKGFFLELDGGRPIILPHQEKKVFNNSALVPAMGVQIKRVEISMRENIVQDYPYFGLRLAAKL